MSPSANILPLIDKVCILRPWKHNQFMDEMQLRQHITKTPNDSRCSTHTSKIALPKAADSR